MVDNNRFTKTLNFQGVTYSVHSLVDTDLLSKAQEQLNNPKYVLDQIMRGNLNKDKELSFTRRVINAIIRAKSENVTTLKLQSKLSLKDIYNK